MRSRWRRIAVIDASLEEIAVELDAIRSQRGADAVHDQRAGPLAQRFGVPVGGAGEAGCELGHVVALIAVLGHRFVARAGAHRGAELGHLRAGVVEVVLAGDAVAAQLEQPRDRVPVGGVAAGRGGQRTGRVGRDELDDHLLRVLRLAPPPAVAGGHDPARRADVPGVGEEDVEEAGSCDLDVVDGVAEPRGQLRPEALGDLARGRAERRREQHRRVRRVVPEAGLLGTFEAGARDRGRVAVAKIPRSRLDCRPQLVDRVHGYDVSRNSV